MIAESPWRLVLNSFDNLRLSASENDTTDESTALLSGGDDDDGDDGDVINRDADLESNGLSLDRRQDIFVAPRVCNVFLRGHRDKLASICIYLLFCES